MRAEFVTGICCRAMVEPRGACGVRFSDLPPRRPPDMPAHRMRVIRGGKI